MDLKNIEEKVKIFVDREEELSDLQLFTKLLKNNTPRHIILYGIRRMGKTFLLWKFITETEKNIIPIYIDCFYFEDWNSLYNRIIDEFWENYIQKEGKKILWKALKEKLIKTLNNINQFTLKIGKKDSIYLSLMFQLNKQKKSFEDVIRILDTIAKKEKKKIILILDEFQEITTLEKWQKQIGILRGELQKTNNIMLILSGSKPSFFKKAIFSKTKPFWKQLGVYEIKPFKLNAIEQLIKKTKVKEVDPVKLLELSKGIPDYAYRLIMLYKQLNSLEKAFKKIAEEETQYIYEVLDDLSPKERKIVLHIGKGKHKYSDIKKAMGKEISTTLKRLINKGIIEKTPNGYEIQDPIIEYTIKSNA